MALGESAESDACDNRGAAITIFTGVTVWRSGSRQLALGLGAAGVTFVIGRIIGTTLT
jgi:VIT1/CCC1 family predicted Fe2+/Mn2+ transporter